ncbi:2-dehydro-3-deoxy-6-phosphogalactonate aldolase [Salipiger aestuarii]|uniref:2-dehydro-3-deoxyphosphogalactonate aldolase n=1 Tax=Salipiger aestuarii TaxID=568098 RepID=A0A327Y6E9_9RHOB|nr:2-dehydro-3-deoxy-6-phosphogalactonate aldolase [Salipiger aestuarii]KAA8607751.1 2-dehydro-3-deoxy-6-phosphogalactonate aldolase [Salipiger aestuarii]KAA8609421.1 2-dehydro-3-deoxy-6-phosphogalactonate aldolase [Salipiger aestuarii]KAB2542016.1 2-dehydro-3-deoxy-6-phosphogalactonate aldolase [Salipiger aestuarii]RAK15586.1 2-dehydro-3-deoxyphosphogalactonate aldolase [Salipiger aestuarii]
MTDTARSTRLDAACTALPLVAILRGLTPPEAVGIAQTLYDAGFRLIEIPLNSPQPFDSIAAVRAALPADALVGAGTVTTPADVARLNDIGADLVVMPHADVAVIAAAKAAGLICMPGIATPTEAYAALHAGADALKIFPAELVGPAAIKAIRTILPAGTRVFPVGGISPGTMPRFHGAGVAGFGLGGALYKPGDTVGAVARKAGAFVEAWRDMQP